MNVSLSEPPFNKVSFPDSELNSSLNQVSNLIHRTDSIMSESDFLMGQFLDSKLNEELLEISDTSSNLLVSLFALYHSDIESSNRQNQEVINSFFDYCHHLLRYRILFGKTKGQTQKWD